MRMTDSEIKQEILDNLEQFKEATYPEDLFDQFADSALPIYYGEIIRDWQEMPSEYNDSWQELGMGGNETITHLMQVDLYFYYRDTYNRIYQEVMAEQEELENV